MAAMAADLSVTFTGLRFENPFLLASAPPTESENNILNAFEAGWGGVVTKTIGMHPVVNVAGPKTKFLRYHPEPGILSMNKGRGGVLHSSWNWELISDKPLDWWLPRIERIKKAFPTRVLIASIMAGSGNDKELEHWRTLASSCQDAGADGLELNLSCPHMDRPDMGSNIGKDPGALLRRHRGGEGRRARARLGQAHARDRRHRRRSRRRLPGRRRRRELVEHVSVDSTHRPRDAGVRDERRRPRLERRAGRSGDSAAVAGDDVADDAGVSRPARSPASAASPTSAHALNYFMLGCGTVQVCTAAMLDHAVGPNVIKRLLDGIARLLRETRRSRLAHVRRHPRPRPRPRRRRTPRSVGPNPQIIAGGYEQEGYAEQ